MFYLVLKLPNQQRLLSENTLYNLPYFKISFCDSLGKLFLNIRGFSSLYVSEFVFNYCIFNSLSSFFDECMRISQMLNFTCVRIVSIIYFVQKPAQLLIHVSYINAEKGKEDDTRLNVATYSQNERCLLQFMFLLSQIGEASVEIMVCKSCSCSC